jgi:gliding motility-associated-like protein
MKKFFSLLVILLCGLCGFANHITGGEIYYRLTNFSGTTYTYHVTLKLYRDCNSTGAQLDPAAPISIFTRGGNTSVWANSVPLGQVVVSQITNPDPCISNPPPVCYQIGYYEFDVTLPGSADGYTIAYQRCCRIAGINNLIGSSSVGATYTAQIPGNVAGTTKPAAQNHSAHFTGDDKVIICANNYFCYDFGAEDLDGDSLVYYHCTAYTSQQNPPNPNPPANPPYTPVPYASPFNESIPLGSGVSLNPNTGMMCGIAPPAGIYVVTVCVAEYRNGILIATQRKDLQIKVGDCNLVDAALPTSYPVCDDFTRVFENLTPPNPLVHTYLWSFGDPVSGANNTSNQPMPTHTFSDTGVYHIKLVINQGETCADSATSVAYVYPGFFPNFYFQGICINKPTQFFDSSRTVYGFINSWSWDFGNNSASNDTSHLQSPTYTYNTIGSQNVRFIVTSNKGCIDTVYREVVIMDKPVLHAVPKDTLICNGAQVVLGAVGSGVFSWTGPFGIINGGTANPTVQPTVTSNFIVQLNDNGCINLDTVRVRVVNFVSLAAMPDTVICATDSIRLTGQSNGLHYTWTPVATIAQPTRLTTNALPVTNTTYHIRATIDHCIADDDVNVILVPYPFANAGPDTTICFNSAAQLHAIVVGSTFTWSPSNTLSNANSLNPVATPFGTTKYILTARDTLGCPKPKSDTVVVNVLPKINPFAGNDTAVVVGQPLQFNATGGISYEWSPSTGLNHTNIHNPLAFYDGSFDSIIYKVIISNEQGCADSDYIKVVIFKTNPSIFVPTAFTPNSDGKNDVFRPIAVGISKFEYFRVFNRWGQLVFETKISGRGWDGKIGGKEQGSNTYVWVVKGTDWTGKQVFEKGTVTLIR